jgi:hypothetical protein
MALAVVNVVTGTSATDKYVEPSPIICSLAVVGTSTIWTRYTTTVSNLILLDVATGSHLTTYPESSFASSVTLPVGTDSSNNAYVRAPSDGRIQRCAPGGGAIDYFIPTHDDGSGGIVVDGSTIWGISSTDGSAAQLTSIDYGAHTCTETLATGANRTIDRYALNALAIAGRIYGVAPGGSFLIRYIDTTGLTGTDVIASCDGRPVVVGDDGNIYSTAVSGGDTVLRQHDQDGTLLNSLTFTAESRQCALYDADGFLWITGVSSALDFKKVDPVTMTVVATVANAGYVNVVGEPSAGVPAVFLVTGNRAIGVIYDVDVTAGLTGAAATSSAGSVGAPRTASLDGVQGFGNVGEFAPQETSDVGHSVALTGLVATTGLGSLVITEAPTGVSATSASGSVSVTRTRALAGQPLAGSVGSVVATISASGALTGVAGTGHAGSFMANIVPTGVSSATAVGTVGSAVTVALTGASAVVSMGVATFTKIGVLTSVAATGSAGSVAAGVRSLELAGVQSTPVTGRVVVQQVHAKTAVIWVTSVIGALDDVAPVANPDITTFVTGVSGTSAVGYVYGQNVAITGAEATGASGSTASTCSAALTNVVATKGVGTMGKISDSTCALTGRVATGSRGTVKATRDKTPTGNSATGSVGTVTPV